MLPAEHRILPLPVVYGKAKHISVATLPGLRERTILMSGFSKAFSATGWQIG
jgi:aminotransferase